MPETVYQCINAYKAANGDNSHHGYPECFKCLYNWNQNKISDIIPISDILTANVLLSCPISKRKIPGIKYTFSDEQVRVLERLAMQLKLYERRN